MQQEYADFTPGIPVQKGELGERIQVVDGKERVLHPGEAVKIEEWQAAGMPDAEIAAWLSVT